MSLYPILWAVEHAPVRDAEERAILVALVSKGDFDGMNCYRSYITLGRVARVDPKTAGRKCREMEKRGILRRQTAHFKDSYLKIPQGQRPVAWEVMIPASWYSPAQLAEINEKREEDGRPPITRQSRPDLTEAPPKAVRSDKGKSRPKKDTAEGPGTESPPSPGTDSPGSTAGKPGTESPRRGDCEYPEGGLRVPQISESPSESPSETAPSARSARGVRSTSTSGGRPSADSSGSAAASKTPKLSREDMARVRAVEGLLPALLVSALPYGRIPARNRGSVLEALESRTTEQIRERIARRWEGGSFEPLLRDGEVRTAVGVAMRLIEPTPYCPDLSCEDGVLLDTGAECRACEEREAVRREARAAGEAVPTGRPARRGAARRPVCSDCERPFRGEVPESGQCKDCHAEMLAAFQRATLPRPAAPADDQTTDPAPAPF